MRRAIDTERQERREKDKDNVVVKVFARLAGGDPERRTIGGGLGTGEKPVEFIVCDEKEKDRK